MLKAGFIGFGRMGITHYSILNSHPSVEIVAVCDRSKTMLNLLKKYVNIQAYFEYQDMIINEDLDFVVISTPSDSHGPIIKFAIEHDLHVFTEKPFVLDPSEGQEILTLVENKPLANQVGYVNRFNEVFYETKNIIDNGIIGEVKSFRSEMYGATVLKDSKSSWRGNKKSGGGCMYEFASHCIDLVVFLIGQPDRIVGSVLQSIYSSGVEDLVNSTFLYNSGIIGTINVNWSDPTYRKPANYVTIIGTGGKIIADKHAYKIFLNEARPEHGFEKGWNTRYITDFTKGVRFYVRGNEFTSQLDSFVASIQNGTANSLPSFSEGFKTDSIMKEITLDAKLSKETEPYLERTQAPITVERLKTQVPFWRRLFNK